MRYCLVSLLILTGESVVLNVGDSSYYYFVSGFAASVYHRLWRTTKTVLQSQDLQGL